MKKLILVLILILLPFSSFAITNGDSSGTFSYYPSKENPHRIVLSWTADSGDGSFTSVSFVVAGKINRIVTDPGSTAPTDNYDITITDADGIDVCSTPCQNRSTSATQEAYPPLINTYFQRYIHGLISIDITGNSVASANGTIVIYVE